jgi:hypothetical protein
MKIRYRWFVILFSLLCTLPILWILLSIINRNSIIQDFTIYSKSENVQINTIVQGYPWVRRIISFQTSDPSEQVLAYYHQLLVGNGWRMVEDRDGITLFVSGGCPFASVEIVIGERDGKTVVKITLAQQPCT